MSRHVVILVGSPRARGNSAVLAEQVAVGAREAGAETESFFLHGMDIRPCRGCDSCKKTGACVIKDDMRTISPKLLAADAVVLASPVYWFTFTAQLKTCIDRWYALWNARNDMFKGKSIGIVLVYGDTDLVTSGGKNAVSSFKSMFGFLESDIVGLVHGSVMNIGDAHKNPQLMKKAYQLGKKLAS
jgi:multimeric flavodoxin WrbA